VGDKSLLPGILALRKITTSPNIDMDFGGIVMGKPWHDLPPKEIKQGRF
jgi:hypothetical protein